MDPRYDNYLVETFAVAVSFEVLKELGLGSFRTNCIMKYTASLPQSVQTAISSGNWREATSYWQSEIPNQKSKPFGKWDFSFATLGALILEAFQQPVWANLLGASTISDQCYLPDGAATAAKGDAMEFKTCSPTVQRMVRLGPALKALGYRL